MTARLDSHLVAGGTTSDGGTVNTAEIYDPSANSWSAPITMMDARAGHTASSLSDGRVLLAGGHESAGNALSSLDLSKADAATKYYVERQLLEFRLAGVNKDEATRNKLKELNVQLSVQ